jgi:hypothetical protein
VKIDPSCLAVSSTLLQMAKQALEAGDEGFRKELVEKAKIMFEKSFSEVLH